MMHTINGIRHHPDGHVEQVSVSVDLDQPGPHTRPRQESHLSAADFLQRFTPEQWAAVRKLAPKAPAVQHWIDMLLASSAVDVVSESSLAAKAAVVAAKLLTQDLADGIFAPVEV